ncbi:MAG TPA: hypothetical protein VMS02_09205 [Solirubrobacteraceae bacterium]|nr:hypothetical protein [Solirubrobacteraceae bacterium]
MGKLAACCALVTAVAAAAAAAHTLDAADEAHLHVINASGSLLIEEGQAKGGLPGTVRVSFRVGANVSGSFMLYPHGGGLIVGRAEGTLRSTGAYASFGGTLTITGGSGRYAHAHGKGGLYGTVNRRNDALVVQTTGKLYF